MEEVLMLHHSKKPFAGRWVAPTTDLPLDVVGNSLRRDGRTDTDGIDRAER